MIKTFLIVISFSVLLSTSLVSATEPPAQEQSSTRSATTESSSTVAVANESSAVSEDQIPLNIDNQAKTAAGSGNGTKMILSLTVVAGLLGAIYYGLRRYSVKSKLGQSNMQIKVLSQHFLGPKKSLAIIRVAGESILIGVTDQNISLIKPLSLLDDELPQVMPQNFEDSMLRDV